MLVHNQGTTEEEDASAKFVEVFFLRGSESVYETDSGLLWALSLYNQSEVLTAMIKTMNKHLPAVKMEVRQRWT